MVELEAAVEAAMAVETDDSDAKLVSEIVENVAIPILHHRIVRCWDILSTRETRNAVTVTSLVKNYVSASSEALAELFAVIRARLVEGVSIPTWDPLLIKAVPNAPQVVAYRFATSVRLMRNICMWKCILTLPVLENLALSGLLFGKVLPHVRGIASNSSMHDAVTRTEDCCFFVWSMDRTKRQKNSQSLSAATSCGLYYDTRGTLEKRLASGLDDAESTGLAHRLKGILVEIHEHEHANEIVRTFNLKEAL